MSLALSSVIGSIQFDPVSTEAAGRVPADDSTLGLLLASLARDAVCLDGEESAPPWAIRRWRVSRLPAVAEGGIALEANLGQLLADIEDEYKRFKRLVPDAVPRPR
jgi:hypothetical protein